MRMNQGGGRRHRWAGIGRIGDLEIEVVEGGVGWGGRSERGNMPHFQAEKRRRDAQEKGKASGGKLTHLSESWAKGTPGRINRS